MADCAISSDAITLMPLLMLLLFSPYADEMPPLR